MENMPKVYTENMLKEALNISRRNTILWQQNYKRLENKVNKALTVLKLSSGDRTFIRKAIEILED